MEAATPVFSKYPEKIDFIQDKIIKNEYDEYKISLGTNEFRNTLVIRIIPENSKNISFYQNQYNLLEFQNLSPALNFYKSIDDLILAFPGFINEVYEKNDQFIIRLILFRPNGEKEITELTFEKEFCDQKKAIKALSNELRLLKNSINEKNNEILDLKNDISNKKNMISSLESNNLNNINEISSIRQSLMTFQNENVKLKEKISYLESEKMTLIGRINNMQQQANYQKLQKKIANNDLMNELNQLQEKYKQLQIKFNELERDKKRDDVNSFPGDNSEIIFSMSDLQFIFNYIKQTDKSFKFNYLKLLYRGSRDGDNTKICHELCDDKQNILIIIKSDIGNIFGGYSKIGFKISDKPEYLIDNNCFLFSFELKKIFTPVKNKKHISHIYGNNGLCFTGSLAFFNNFMHINDNYIFKTTIKEYFNKLDEPCEMNGGKNKFRCEELEVFQFT